MSIKSSIKAPALRLIFALGRLRQSLLPTKPVDLAHVESVLLVQLGGIGDVLLIFPLLDALQRLLPGRRLATLTEYGDWLFELFPGESDGLRHFVLDLSANYRDKLRRLAVIRRGGVDLVVCASRGDGIVESSVVSALCGAHWRIGFGWGGSKLLYTHVLPFSVEQPVWRQNLQLLQQIGLGVEPVAPRLKIPPEADKAGCKRLHALGSGRGPVVLFHPWAGNFAHLKTWPLLHYAELAQRLIREYGAIIGILGSATDRASGDELRSAVGSPACVNLCGKLSFVETAIFIRHARLLVGNDSALLHVASGVDTPSVGIFGSTSAEQLLSLDSGCRVVMIDVDCGPCYLHQPWATHECDQGVKCLKGIGVDQVYEAAREALAKSN